jgi:uncharacterized protein GlcG (DUF336 family)
MNPAHRPKITLTVTEPDGETIAWVAEKMRNAYLRELDVALEKAQTALREGRQTTIRTKSVKIEVGIAEAA